MQTKCINFDIIDGDDIISPRLSEPESFDRLVNGDAILDERDQITVVIEYPLPKPRNLKIHGPVTLETFARAVASAYRMIFSEKKKDSKLAPQPRLEHLTLSGADRRPDGTWRLLIEV